MSAEDWFSRAGADEQARLFRECRVFGVEIRAPENDELWLLFCLL